MSEEIQELELCYICNEEPATFNCSKCGGPTGEHCRSQLAPESCHNCLNEAIGLREMPLKDEEGVTHKGRILEPTGYAYKSMAKQISEMTDDELDEHVARFETLVRETELALQYRKTTLSTARLEKDERYAGHLKKLRGVKVRATGFKVDIGGKRKSDPRQVFAGVVEVLKASGMSEAQILEHLQKMVGGKPNA